MKLLILTEKPSQGRDFAKALNVPIQGTQGYFENDEVIITWAIGHLLELKSPEEYKAEWKKWSLENLPIIPERLSYKGNKKTKKQLGIVTKCLKRKDLSKVIVATDAGREGELIARTLLMNANSKIKAFRFWTSEALNKNVIIEGIKNAKPLEEYNRLYYAGRARQSADWLVGMNLSRLATIKMNALFSVGRVQTAVLSLLVERRGEIDSFVSTPYYHLEGSFIFNHDQMVKALWFDESKKSETHKIEKLEKIKEICLKLQNKRVKVLGVKEEEKRYPPPLLFSLTELQKVANRVYGFSAKKTLGLAQDLYEKKKCLSYPRTDSHVLGEKMVGQVKKVTEKLQQNHRDFFDYFEPRKIALNNRRVFNNEKLTDHHALIPLKDYQGSYQSDEGKIFLLVIKRFLAAFSSDYVFDDTTLTLEVGGEKFKTKGTKIKCLGFKSLLGAEKEKILPKLNEGDVGSIEQLEPLNRKTMPPPEYTDALLLQDMISPAKLVEKLQYKKIFRGEVGLGTQATRAQIIEVLISRGYIKRDKKELKALSKGIFLIQNLKKLPFSKNFVGPEETAKWELELSAIAAGEGDPKGFMVAIRRFVTKSTEEWKRVELDKFKSEFKEIGTCPLCQGKIRIFSKSYSCENWKSGCSFTIWKMIAKKIIPQKEVLGLIKRGKSSLIEGFTSKQGKKFNASLIFNKENKKIEFDFNNQNSVSFLASR